ncbi:MAG TPA: aminotransferase class I/II-fold pyridoxal phosphate-dependent enzyme [Candidatus Polarisedimenticolia bacterium]|nr:aminotransferase class I/II-fold pyridoxal phosphate-dependent enzyme [Candidatus Polarisedimenticolia bacterium]
MYIPAWQGLSPRYLLRNRAHGTPPFPLDRSRSIYFYRASSALYHLFRALRLEEGQTALVPDYHSGNEVWALRAAGVPVRFYPVRRTMQPDLEALERLCTPDVRVLLVIHYLGWPQPMQAITALCRKRRLILVEDCALSLLSQDGGRPLGTFGDHAVFCLYKTLPLPNGALLAQNTDRLPELAALDLQACAMRSVAGRSMELMLGWLRSRSELTGRSLFTIKRVAARALDALSIRRHPLGDIGFDLSNVNIGMSPLCHALLKRFDYRQIVRVRRRNYTLLASLLEGKVALAQPELPEGVCPLFLPILVPDKRAAAETLWRQGIEAVQFWNEGDPEASADPSTDAMFLRRHVLELPIHHEVAASQIEYIAERVLAQRRLFAFENAAETAA